MTGDCREGGREGGRDMRGGNSAKKEEKLSNRCVRSKQKCERKRGRGQRKRVGAHIAILVCVRIEHISRTSEVQK